MTGACALSGGGLLPGKPRHKFSHFHPRLLYAILSPMTNGELTERLLNIAPPHLPVKCLQVGDEPEEDRLFHIVNVHEDLTGVVVIIEEWTGG